MAGLPHLIGCPPAGFADVLDDAARSVVAVDWTFDQIGHVDRFQRPDGPLGGGWTDAGVVWPDRFNPLTVRSGAVACAQPLSRPVQAGGAPTRPAPGWVVGTGCAWIDTGVRDVTVTVAVLGDTSATVHQIEGAPLLHVTPGTDTLGFGAWAGLFADGTTFGIGLVGTIGQVPEDFDVTAYWLFTHSADPHTITVRSVGGQATVAMNGQPQQLYRYGTGTPLATATVPAELAASTMHGFGYDTHLTGGRADVQVIDWVRMEAA